MSIPHIARWRVAIAGGGVAGLETLMALRDLGEGELELTLIAPQDDFVLRPMAVTVPFGAGEVTHIALDDVCARFGARWRRAAVTAVDPARHTLTLSDGDVLAYDRLVLATGAAPRPAYRWVLTFDADDPAALRDLVGDVERGACPSLALVVPPSGSWSLPIYELALLIARHARATARVVPAIHVVTPEPTPLAIFGPRAASAVAELLDAEGIVVHAGCFAAIERPGHLALAPGGGTLDVARIVALPALVGRRIAGVPSDEHGFVPVDDHGRVVGVADVYAVGDGADYPVKQGGLAAQQADAAARDIAARAGAPVEAQPFAPVLRGLLLTGGTPRYLRRATAEGQDEGRVSNDRLWWPPAKVVGHYLAPWLAREHQLAAAAPTAPAIAVQAALPADRDARPLALEPLGPLPRRGRW